MPEIWGIIYDTFNVILIYNNKKTFSLFILREVLFNIRMKLMQLDKMPFLLRAII